MHLEHIDFAAVVQDIFHRECKYTQTDFHVSDVAGMAGEREWAKSRKLVSL
jgi:hypothetical protein